MDPNSCLQDLLALANKLLDGIFEGRYHSLGRYESEVDDLCELVLILDEELSKGGKLPSRWQQASHSETGEETC